MKTQPTKTLKMLETAKAKFQTQEACALTFHEVKELIVKFEDKIHDNCDEELSEQQLFENNGLDVVIEELEELQNILAAII
jgi:hypothetical protein